MRTWIGLCALLVLLAGCAKQVAPTGGEKDITPPRILASDPLNESINFQESSISLEFDEYVSLRSANQELIVSPPFKYPVEFKLKNRKVTVSWKDTLDENTTYLLQFGEGIVDVNEGNVLDSSVFVFSTGSYIDSMQVKAKVVDAFDLKPVEDVWVMLYDNNVDSMPYKELPRYFAKTDALGMVELRYLSPGDYKCFALQASNAGYLFDIPDEAVGFLESTVTSSNPVDSNSTDSLYTIRLFVQEDSVQFMQGFSQIKNQGIRLIFNRPVEKLELNELAGKDISGWTDNWSANRDTITYWFPAPDDYDSLKLDVNVGDFRDTVFFRKPSSKGLGGKKGKKGIGQGLQLKSGGGKVQHFKWFSVRSETPISKMDFSQAVFTEDGDTVEFMEHIEENFYGFKLKYPWKESGEYTLLVPDSSIADRYGQQNDTLMWKFSTTRKEDFGQLIIQHTLPDEGYQYIWQLLKEDGKVVDERLVSPKGKVNYDHLATGKYQVRILHDANGNEIWDTGYYPGKRQPERVVYFDEQIEVRSNWVTETAWELRP